MYIPPPFAETDQPTIEAFLRQHSFGLLVSTVEGVPFASHLPLLLETAAQTKGFLLGHMARANPQWQALACQAVLAIFAGPHAYVSPSWYEDQQVVPTWNYAAVHVYGTAQIVDSREALRQLVERTVQVYESMLPAPWQLDARASYVDGLLDQIVGFRIAIERVEAKFKLSQNQPLARQQRVAQALAEQGGEAAAVAALMSQRMHKKGSDS